MDKQKLCKILTQIAEDLIENQEMLNKADNVIGDGDHGTNMARGAKKVLAQMPQLLQKDDLGEILQTVGMTMMSTLGGSAGPLFGTFYLRGGMVLKGHQTADAMLFVQSIEAGTFGVSELGMSTEGEKTMLDVLFPASRAFKKKFAEGAPIAECSQAAIEAADKGVEYTSTIIATKGRASYLGERSLGHPDPGALSMRVVLGAMHKVILEETGTE